MKMGSSQAQNEGSVISEEGRKKPFNKKKWREQKYSNKAKVLKWDNIRRKRALRQYNKELKKSGWEFNGQKCDSDSRNNFKENKSIRTIKDAQAKYRQLQLEKLERKKEQERVRKERAEAIAAYKERKAMRFRKICQKTKKGQPLMKGRIELLLEKIQKDYVNNNT